MMGKDMTKRFPVLNWCCMVLLAATLFNVSDFGTRVSVR